MKINVLGLIGIPLLLLIAGCKKNDPEPISITQSKLLAGNENSSKIWQIVSGTILNDNGYTSDLTFSDCFLDNTYTFQNSSTQIYIVREGATKCKTTDPDVTESGYWAFTQDGKNIIIHAQSLSPDTATFGYIDAQIVELTGTSMTISYNTGDPGNKFKITLVLKTVK